MIIPQKEQEKKRGVKKQNKSCALKREIKDYGFSERVHSQGC